jgi:hypothetical protein
LIVLQGVLSVHVVAAWTQFALVAYDEHWLVSSVLDVIV